ncbi:TIGR01212 family radical SAM protein [Clostridium botulinum]|uniref:Radical SAM superfamily protein n=1 Tax=Clostridium botulinum (strain Hall / ATCC 3502 / NCTC 13319 / Type A) TaxID=441771 RepID=A5I7S9_CLOBH|nr:TIGR01212 family radical SAM protein [Clostridium botulinum]ABS34244.1 radical SAM protein, TIGR01212 family [Clostridium botulinum A str. ATCC 19397]ABS38362.1 radical SAM protein, TIGR01212 family [Clostridium botulinum A str. Hall]AUM89577.1 TIGR01212 family radical SAM protein [Clostridium botulinum]AUN12542.1 TIGR01212 family radical SAM protein [Clostridium botulinum]AUN27233.1 TIGR01212 family radical SAM protein [Clostridium botulinum]
MERKWYDKPYHSLNYFLRNKFGCKVFKISLDAGFSCPNRDGKVSKGGCIYCSERGSGDFAGDRNFKIHKQFEDIKKIMKEKWSSDKYIAYFQAYTNTYAPVNILREKYEEAMSEEGVVALAIATRPDCLDQDVLNLIEELSKKIYIWVELGLQTVNDETSKIINRGYKLNVFEKAVKDLRERNIDIVVHSIFGLPGETKEDMVGTVKYISKLDIQGVKFHLLHLLKDTPLVKLYESGNLEFLDMDEYVELICEAITLLPPNMVVHRLTGDAPRNLLVGPMWSLKKWEVLNAIDKKMKEDNLYQGKIFNDK